MTIVKIIAQHFRWRKCKDNLSTLTSTGGANRPGQAGTSGQLFFTKCGDPPQGCPCTYEPKTGETLASFDGKILQMQLDGSLCSRMAECDACCSLQCPLGSKYAMKSLTARNAEPDSATSAHVLASKKCRNKSAMFG